MRCADAAIARIAANFYGRPADRLSLVGVTGTSGKTTTTKMIESMQQMRQEDAEVYRSLHSICRGC